MGTKVYLDLAKIIHAKDKIWLGTILRDKYWLGKIKKYSYIKEIEKYKGKKEEKNLILSVGSANIHWYINCKICRWKKKL